MPRTLQIALVTALLALPAAAVPAAGSAAPSASAARTCSVLGGRHLGFSYVLSLRATGTTCATARSVVRSYHSCRPRGGRCAHRIRGFSCSDHRIANSPAEYDARGTCAKRGASIRFTYSQFK